MLFYIIPLVYTLYCAIVYDINKSQYGKWHHWFVLFVYMTLFMGLRYCVGGDTVNYMVDFTWVPELENYTIISANRYNPGFNLLMSIGKSITADFVGFQLLHSFLLNLLLFYFIHQYSKCPFYVFFISLFVFYYYFSTEILREAIAVLVFALNYKNLVKRLWVRYYILVFISVMFHTSALFLVVLPFLRWIKFNKAYLLIYMLTVIVGLNVKSILNVGTIQIIFDGISNYIEEDTHGMLADLLNLVRNALFPLSFALYVKYGTKKAGSLEFENMIAIMVLLGTLSYFNPIIFSRLCNYFILFFVISFADCSIRMLKSHFVQLRQWSIMFFIITIFVYGSNFVMYNYYTRLVPYYSVFNPIKIDRDSFK